MFHLPQAEQEKDDAAAALQTAMTKMQGGDTGEGTASSSSAPAVEKKIIVEYGELTEEEVKAVEDEAREKVNKLPAISKLPDGPEKQAKFDERFLWGEQWLNKVTLRKALMK